MGRRKTKKNIPLKGWMSARHDCQDGRFIQIGNSLLLDKKYQTLTGGAKHLYICMAMESGGARTFEFSHGSAKKYGIASSTFERNTKELIDQGFICLEESPERGQYAKNVFTFSFAWKDIKSAPHFGEYQK